MSTVKVKGQDVRVNDDLWAFGTPHRITRIEPYVHPVVTRGEPFRIAYADGPGGQGERAWGITLEYGHGYATGYEVTERPGETYINEPPADDWPCPSYGRGAELYPEYVAAGGPAKALWPDWIRARLSAAELEALRIR